MKTGTFMEEEYGLKGNPFLDRIAREVWLQTWVDRDEEVNDWRRIIAAAASGGRNHMVFVIGDYGRGKTLSLLKIVDDAGQYPRVLTSYLNFKGEERPRSPGLDFLFRVFKSVDFQQLAGNRTEVELTKAIDSLPTDLQEVKLVLKKIYFGDAEVSRLAAYFVRGEGRGLVSELRKLGVLRKIDGIDVGKEYLAGLLGFIRALGFSTFLLAVDEFEYLFSLVTRPQQAVYLALLRGLYDFPQGFSREVGPIAGMAFFIAVSEDGWRNLLEMQNTEKASGGPIQPLLDRVDCTSVLGAFDRAETRELIEKRLSYDRVQGKHLNEPLIPFTEDFVDFIFDETGGEPRKTIVRCAHVLDAGLAHGVARLDRKFAEETLEDRGWS